MDAVLRTISLHNSSVAICGWEGSLRRFAARIPEGVAALPKPRKLAQTLVLKCCIRMESFRVLGNSRWSAGRSSAASLAVRPVRSISLPTPAHNAHISIVHQKLEYVRNIKEEYKDDKTIK